MSELTLSVIGSSGLVVKISEAALPEAGPGGVAIELGLHDGPLIVTLTEDEALDLAAALALTTFKRSAVGERELAR